MGEAIGEAARAKEAVGLAAPSLALAGLCIALGAYPGPLLSRAWRAAGALLGVG